MAGCYVERRTISTNSSISWDIAHHLYTRQLRGVAVVISDKADGLLAALTKQWYKILRQTERQRASTLNASRIMELTYEIASMQRLRFNVGLLDGLEDGGVFLVASDQVKNLPVSCHTLYITCELDEPAKTSLIQMMPPGSLVVTYV